MSGRRTESLLWAGGTVAAWTGTTVLASQVSQADVLYCPLVAVGTLFVRPAYGASLGVAALLAILLCSRGDPARVMPAAIGVAAVWVAAYVSARRRREEHEDFERLLSLVRHISSRLDPAEVPTAIVRTAREATSAKASSLRLLAADGKTLELRAAEGLSRTYVDKGPVDVRRTPIDRKVLQGEIVEIRDAATDARVQYPHEAHEEGIASVLCVPLKRKDDVIGVLRVYSARPRHFSRRDVRMLVALADHAVIALRQAELHHATLAFMRKVTHELRAPLAAIGSYVKVLLEGITGALSVEQTDMLRRVDRRTTMLLDAVNDLLALSRARLNKPSEPNVEFRLPAVLDAVVSLMKPKADAGGVTLAVESQSDVPPLVGSPEDIEELVGNLVSNAVKYTQDGGRVTASAAMNGECVLLRVCDTGMGIPSEDLPRLFNEFHRCANARQSGIEGTGLGMAIVKTIADRHHAEVRVESEEGEGTTIEVRFPLART